MNNRPADFIEVIAGSANAETTLTIPAAPGKRHVITSLRIARSATAALTGTASLTITSTNLRDAGGTTATWVVGNVMAAGGTQIDVQASYPDGLRSAVPNTATTIVMPAAGAAVLWNAQATYYLESVLPA